ncbi:MAG TPA: T9SS type A sorting domain-containing protein [Ignavibacteria bacterium]|nr:T9SS type A sorting domain-containing protein [Ignavibacteria bacterium]
MKIIILNILSFVIFANHSAFAQSVLWNSYYRGQNSNDDWGSCIGLDDSGYTYITGITDWGPSGCATIKYKPNGDSVWTRVLGSSSAPVGSGVLIVDSLKNVYIGGSLTLLKYNTNGVIQWERRDSLGGWHISTDAMMFDSSGYIMTTGVVVASGGFYCVVSKFEPQNGNLIWRSLYPILNGDVYAMSIDKNQNVVVCGKRGESFEPTYYDFFVLKFDHSGNFVWYRTYTSTGQFTTDLAYDVTTDDSCNVYATGVGDPGGPFEIVTIKYDSSGTQKWIKTYSNSFGSIGSHVLLDKLGNVIVAGYNNGNDIVIKYANDGSEMWTRLMPDGNYHPAFALDTLNNIYIASARARGSWGDLQVYKYNPNGILQWHLIYPGAGNTGQLPRDMIVDKNGYVYTTGSGFGLGGGTGVKMSTFKISQVTGINILSENIPNKYSLSQNFPNPFNPTTRINFSIPNSGFVSLKVYDMLGREVSVLVNEKLTAGEYSYDFDAGILQSGIYFYCFQANKFSKTNKMILLK